jgi:hypothetical protein
MKNSLHGVVKFLANGKLVHALLFSLILCACTVTVPQGVVVVRAAPPAVIAETPGPRPGPAYFWDPGHWRWNGNRYVWIRGHYVLRTRTAARWVPGHWVQGPRGWYWIEGRWI